MADRPNAPHGAGFEIASAYVTVTADDDSAKRTIDALLTRLEALSKGRYDAEVGVRLGDAVLKLQLLKAQLESLSGSHVSSSARAEGLAAITAELRAITAEIHKLDAESVVIPVTAPGADETAAKLRMVNGLVDDLNGKLGLAAAGSAAGAAAAAAGGGGRGGRGAAAVAAAAAAGRGGGGFLGGLRNFHIPLFGGYLGTNAIIGAASGLHLLSDAIIETAAVVVPATVAFTAFGAAAVPTVQAIYTHMKDLYTVSQATGQSIYPLTGGFQKLADAVQPQVYSIFGDAINVINSRTGTLTQIVTGAGSALDQLAARATLALGSRGMGAFLKNGPADLAKIGDIIGNIFGTAGNLLKVMPGYAERLLSLLDTITKTVEAISANGVVQSILHVGLAAHGLALYSGLAVTALLALRGPVTTLAGTALSLGTRFGFLGDGALKVANSLGVAYPVLDKMHTNLYGVAADAEEGGAKLGFFAEKMGVAAEDTGLLAGAAGILDAIPVWGWVAAGAIALGGLVYWMVSAGNATERLIHQQHLLIDEQTSFSNVVDVTRKQWFTDVSKLLGAQNDLAHTQETINNVNLHTGTVMGRTVNPAYQQATQSVHEYGAAAKNMMDTYQLEQFRLGELAHRFGSVNTAMAEFNMLHIKASDIANASKQKWEQDMTAVAGLTTAQKALAYQQGVLGADMKMLDTLAGNQLTAVLQLNKGWDQWAGIVTGSLSSFDTWTLAMQQIGTQAHKAGVSFDGLNAKSLQFNQNIEASLPQMNAMLDNLRLADLGTGKYSQAVKDMVIQYLPYLKNNDVLLGQLKSISGGAIPSNITSYRQLVHWLGVSNDSTKTLHGAEKNLQGIMLTATSAVDGMTKSLITQIETSLNQAIFKYSGVKTALDNYAKAVDTWGAKSWQAKSAQDHLTQSIITEGHKIGDSKRQIAEMISKIEHIPLKRAFQLVMRGEGAYQIHRGFIAAAPTKSSPHYGVHRHKVAAHGMLVTGGIPGKDSVPILAQQGEAVVPKHLVPHIAPFLKAHKVPGFAAGGLVSGVDAAGNTSVLTGSYATHMVNTFTSVAESALAARMRAAMRAAITAAEARARAAAYSSGSPAYGGSSAAMAFARAHLGDYGWGMSQWPSLYSLWMRESGWNPYAVNASSGAYGIPQSLGHGHPYNLGDYANQVRWGLSYIRSRYGSPSAAWGHEMQFGWYDKGGLLQPGLTLAYNGTGRPERVSSGGGAQVVVNFNGTQLPSPEQLAAIKFNITQALAVAP